MLMRKIICDKCHKEFEEKTSIFATIFINTNGVATERADICIDCWNEILKPITTQTTEKGGVGE